MIDARSVVPVPESIDPAEIEAVLLNGITAWQMLHRAARVTRGQTILVHGATGGVGMILVQLAREAGIRVIGTGSPRNHDTLRQLGVQPLDYRDPNLVERVRELAPDGVDRTRPPKTTPAAAIRDFVFDSVEGIRRVAPEQWRGELGYLATISPTVHRLALEMSDRQAGAIAAAIADTTAVEPAVARLHGIALAGVFQIIISEAGRRTQQGQSQEQIADELRPAIAAVLDDLDRWLV